MLSRIVVKVMERENFFLQSFPLKKCICKSSRVETVLQVEMVLFTHVAVLVTTRQERERERKREKRKREKRRECVWEREREEREGVCVCVRERERERERESVQRVFSLLFPHQLLYAGSWAYASDLWHELVVHRKKFMCEKVILQYIGFVKTHMKMVEKGKHAGTAREGKFFYQVSICSLFAGCSSKIL